MNRLFIWIASCGLYVGALLLPAVQIEGGLIHPEVRVFGYEAALHGWGWPWTIPWLANVALLIGWISFLAKRKRFAAVALIMAVALGLTAPAVYELEFSELGAGYFLWLASCVWLAVFAIAEARRGPGGVSPTVSVLTLP